MSRKSMLSSLAIITSLSSHQDSKQTEQTDRAVFEPEHVTAILDDCDLKFQCISLIALNAALSNTDIALDLRWGAIKWDKKTLDFPRGKKKSIRRTPLWDRTLKKLAEYKKTCAKTADDDRVFLNDNGKPFIIIRTGKNGRKNKNDYLSVAFRKLFRKLGIDASFGIFRKSAATHGLNGGDHTSIEMLLGDAPGSIWRRYAMLTKGQNAKVKAATDAVESYYFPKNSRGTKKRRSTE